MRSLSLSHVRTMLAAALAMGGIEGPQSRALANLTVVPARGGGWEPRGIRSRFRRHRQGSGVDGCRLRAARGPGSYAEHDALVRRFGAVVTRNHERGSYGAGSDRDSEIRDFLNELHKS